MMGEATMWSPGLTTARMEVVMAAMPEANTRPFSAPSPSARMLDTASALGLPRRK